MATKHWGRDAWFNDPAGTYGGNQMFASQLLFHMMRTAGFEWIWECDGEVGPHTTNPNHVEDGNMELADDPPAKWTAYGTATVSKDTSVVRSGSRSLKVVSGASNAGVLSAALLSVSNPYVKTLSPTLDQIYAPGADGAQAIYANYDWGADSTQCKNNTTHRRARLAGFDNPANNGTFLVRDGYYNMGSRYIKVQNPGGAAEGPWASGHGAITITLECRYEIAIWTYSGGLFDGYWKVEVDPGDGAYINVGSLPSTPGWSLSHFSFWAVGTGSRRLRITCTTTGQTIYIDGVNVWRSFFEYAPANVYGTHGILTNPDRFSTMGGDHVPDYQDVGKWLFVWDDENNKNTGFYKILADLGGGVVQLDLRSGTAVLTTNSDGDLNWRIVDLQEGAHNDSAGAFQMSAGFGLRSPHESMWRYFNRLSADNYDKPSAIWVAPNDEADFDFSTGQFVMDGPSSQRSMVAYYSYNVAANTQSWCGPYYAGYALTTRSFFMTDEDRSFIAFVHLGVSYGIHYGFHVVGYMGENEQTPGIEEFASLAGWSNYGGGNEMGFDQTYHFSYYGVGFDSRDLAVPVAAEVLGYGTSDASPYRQTNAGPNPFSGDEWLHPLVVVRDPEGLYGFECERDSDIGVFVGRTNRAQLTVFGDYLHFYQGVCWEWSGEQLV